MNPLNFLSARLQLRVYLTLAVASALLTAAVAGYGAINADLPAWLSFGLAAVGSLSTITNAVAASHVTDDDAGPGRHEATS